MSGSDRSNADDEPTSPGALPRRLGRYVLRRHLAAGGMGEVYLAELRGDGGFRKWVALKLIHADVARSPKFQEMFRREARLAALVVDPHVCQVFDFGEADGACFLAMEYLLGQPLSTVAERAARSGGMSPVLAARIIADAARGLHAMHSVRDPTGEGLTVVHRDVSPQNIFVLYTGQSKVLDFGIARPAERTGEFTRTGEIKGKPAYLSPEQARGEPLTPQVDLWALGVVLWEITLGRRLFRRKSDAESLAAVLTDPVEAPSQIQPGYPPALEAVVLRALERDLSKRYTSGLELARDLERYITGVSGVDGRDAVAEHLAAAFVVERESQEQALHTSHPSLTPPAPRGSLRPQSGLHDTPLVPLRRSVLARWWIPLGVMFSLGVSGVALRLVRGAEGTAVAQDAAPALPVDARTEALAVPPPMAPPTQDVPGAEADVPGVPRRSSGHTARTHAHPGPSRGASAQAPRREEEADDPRPTTGAGHLTLNAPPATVYLGSRRLGRTPLYGVVLAPGEHTIRVVPDDGTPEQEATVSVEAGATTALRMRW